MAQANQHDPTAVTTMMIPIQPDKGWLMSMVFGTHLQEGILNWMRHQMDPAHDFARLLRTRFTNQIKSMRFRFEHNGTFYPRLEVVIDEKQSPAVLHSINEAVTTFFGAFVNAENAISQGAYEDLTSESFRTSDPVEREAIRLKVDALLNIYAPGMPAEFKRILQRYFWSNIGRQELAALENRVRDITHRTPASAVPKPEPDTSK